MDINQTPSPQQLRRIEIKTDPDLLALFEEMVDKCIGKKGTLDRDDLDARHILMEMVLKEDVMLDRKLVLYVLQNYARP